MCHNGEKRQSGVLLLWPSGEQLFRAGQCAGLRGRVPAWRQEAWPVGLALPLCVHLPVDKPPGFQLNHVKLDSYLKCSS